MADEKGDEVVIYLNKGYSANHAPFFASFEARSQMALEAGADRIVPIEGLHHRLTMAYTVPIRIAMMIQDGVTDYVDAAEVNPAKIKNTLLVLLNVGYSVVFPVASLTGMLSDGML